MTRDALVDHLVSAITAVVCSHPLRVAIDGVDAAGKTTLADELARAVERLGRPVICASIDGFHNPRDVRRRRGSLSPDGYFHDSFNYPALVAELLQPLGPGGARRFRRAVFDFRTDRPVDVPVEAAAPHAVLIFDGVFLLRQELRAYFDFSVFVRADFEVTGARAEQRDAALFGSVEEVRRRYAERYVPGQRIYLNAADPERWASIVIDNNDPAKPAMVSRASPARPFVIVSGLPGSGKTTLARQLAPALGLPLLDKDDILEQLFESKGVGDAVWRRQLSRESDAILRAEATISTGAVLASFWHVPGMPQDSGTPIAWLAALSPRVVNVHCACPPEIAARRFAERSRHPGHLDHQSTYADVKPRIDALVPLGPVDIGSRIEVDTSGLVDVAALTREVRAALGRLT